LNFEQRSRFVHSFCVLENLANVLLLCYGSFDQAADDCVSFLERLDKVLVKMAKYVEDNDYVSTGCLIWSLTAVSCVVELAQAMLKV